jgi:hypothetical protein
MAQLKAAQYLARDLAEALGDDWHWEKPDEDHVMGFIDGPDGRKLGVHIDTYGKQEGKKGEIRGMLPQRDAKGDYFSTSIEVPSIGFTVARGVDAIARDVQRRLLPDYEVAFQRTQEALARRNEYLAETTDSIAAIVEAVPDLGWRRRPEFERKIPAIRRSEESSASFDLEGAGWGDIKAHGDSVSLEARSLSREQVIRMLKALAEG